MFPLCEGCLHFVNEECVNDTDRSVETCYRPRKYGGVKRDLTVTILNRKIASLKGRIAVLGLDAAKRDLEETRLELEKLKRELRPLSN